MPSRLQRNGAAVLALLLAAVPAAASPPGGQSDADLQSCLSKPEAAQSSGMNECVAQATEMWTRRMDRAYRELRAQLDAPSRRLLDASQEAWQAYRARELAFSEGPWRRGGGTFQQASIALFHEAELRARAQTLEGYLQIK